MVKIMRRETRPFAGGYREQGITERIASIRGENFAHEKTRMGTGHRGTCALEMMHLNISVSFNHAHESPDDRQERTTSLDLPY